MRNEKKLTAISVESKKGGVGKTSVVLNIGRILVELDDPEHVVVAVDLDITGTPANKAVRSLMAKNHTWNDTLRVVSLNDQNNKNDLDLVELFESYMSGHKLPEVSWTDSNAAIYLNPERVNVISSYLKRKGADQKSKDNGAEKESEYTPAALFDELHSEWFIHMIKEFTAQCLDVIPDGKALVILFDNSPGYTGLAPVLEDWLTDFGPECGKFLFVSSFEPQDFDSCINSLKVIHRLFRDKWTASRAYAQLKNIKHSSGLSDDNNPNKFNKRQVEFVVRLSDEVNNSVISGNDTQQSIDNKPLCAYPAPDIDKHPGCNKCGLCFYRCQSDVTKHIGENNLNDERKYLGLILNRTPDIVGSGEYSFDAGTVKESVFAKHEYIKKTMVSHHDALMVQFIASRLKKVEETTVISTQTSIIAARELPNVIQKLDNIQITFKNAIRDDNWDINGRINTMIAFIEHLRIAFSIPQSKTLISAFVDFKYAGYCPSLSHLLLIYSLDALTNEIDEEKIKANALQRADNLDTEFDININEIINRSEEIYYDSDINKANIIAVAIFNEIFAVGQIRSPSFAESDINRKKAMLKTIAQDIAIAKDIAKSFGEEKASMLFREISVFILVMFMLSKSDIEKKAGFYLKEASDMEYINSRVGDFLRHSIGNHNTIRRDGLAMVYKYFCLNRARMLFMKDHFMSLTDCLKTIAAMDEITNVKVAAIKDLAIAHVVDMKIGRRKLRNELRKFGLPDGRNQRADDEEEGASEQPPLANPVEQFIAGEGMKHFDKSIGSVLKGWDIKVPGITDSF